jgi:hypothetical protein
MLGNAIVVKKMMIVTVTSSSISVKPSLDL